MPTNLPPQARAVYEEYQNATDPGEKIKKLEEYLSLIPKHKGTENLREQVKKKLAKLRVKKEKKKKKGTKTTQLFTVPKKLDVQLPFFGVPECGKSSLFKVLTGAMPKIGKRTRVPHQGAFYFQGVGIQIVDLPPIFSTDLRATPHGTELMGIARNADLLCLVLDLSQSISWQWETLIESFKEARIKLKAKKPPVTFKELKKGGIRIFGIDYLPLDERELREIISSAGISNCVFEAYGELSREETLNTISRDISRKPAIIVGTKADISGSKSGLEKLESIIDLPIVVTSSTLEKGITSLGKMVIERLNLIRVWTSSGDRKRAVVLKKGATVKDAAEKIHSSFAENLRYAKVTRKGAKVERKRVGADFQLQDNDQITFTLE